MLSRVDAVRSRLVLLPEKKQIIVNVKVHIREIWLTIKTVSNLNLALNANH